MGTGPRHRRRAHFTKRWTKAKAVSATSRHRCPSSARGLGWAPAGSTAVVQPCLDSCSRPTFEAACTTAGLHDFADAPTGLRVARCQCRRGGSDATGQSRIPYCVAYDLVDERISARGAYGDIAEICHLQLDATRAAEPPARDARRLRHAPSGQQSATASFRRMSTSENPQVLMCGSLRPSTRRGRLRRISPGCNTWSDTGFTQGHFGLCHIDSRQPVSRSAVKSQWQGK